MYGFCNQSIVPCRKEPSHRSEQVSQLLFGESFEVLEEAEGDWLYIKTTFDAYFGWVCKSQIKSISEATFLQSGMQEAGLTALPFQLISNEVDHSYFPIVMGSSLPFLREGRMEFEKNKFSFSGKVAEIGGGGVQPEQLISVARMYLESPYLWGGRTHFGIDCSGFTQMVFKMNGVKLPRDASQQAGEGQTLTFAEEARVGDLAFFENQEGKIVHTGIIMHGGNIIHASGRVRIDKFDHFGIFNQAEKKYSHRLRLIKSILHP